MNKFIKSTGYDKLKQICNSDESYSYKELCDLLHEPYLHASSKNAQIKEWNKYFVISKFGTKYSVIREKTEEEIYNENLKETYELLLENMLCYLIQKYDGKRFTLDSIMSFAGLVNPNYITAKYNSNIIEEMTKKNFLVPVNNEPILSTEIDKFISRTEPNYRQKIKSALNRLDDENVIMYTEYLYYVVKSNGYYKSFDPTKEEISKFIDISNDILHNKVKVQYKSQMNREQRYYYNKELLKEVRKQLHWNFYGYKYEINTNKNLLTNKVNYNCKELRKRINDKTKDGLLRNAENYNTFIKWFIDADCDISLKEEIRKFLKNKG